MVKAECETLSTDRSPETFDNLSSPDSLSLSCHSLFVFKKKKERVELNVDSKHSGEWNSYRNLAAQGRGIC